MKVITEFFVNLCAASVLFVVKSGTENLTTKDSKIFTNEIFFKSN